MTLYTVGSVDYTLSVYYLLEFNALLLLTYRSLGKRSECAISSSLAVTVILVPEKNRLSAISVRTYQ